MWPGPAGQSEIDWCRPGIVRFPPNWPACCTFTSVKWISGMLIGGGCSGSKVIGMSPNSLPEIRSVYIVVSPPLMVDVEPLAASTWYFLPAGPSTIWCRSPMSVFCTTYFRACLVLPSGIVRFTTPW
ncbi:hypothetical protein SALBM135S_03507 [Streptomyces alboniger]